MTYDLANPTDTFELPEELMEVSGITDISDSVVACVQDEDGQVFFYDLTQRKVTHTVRFGGPGDYEGLTAVQGRLFVLRSDGRLLSFEYSSSSPVPKEVDLTLPTKNNEGLCFDPFNNRLLIAAKSPPGKGKTQKDDRLVFGFDLNTEQLLSEPVLRLNIEDIRALVSPTPDAPESDGKEKKKNKKKTKGEKKMRFLPASLAVHPKSQEIYLLSAHDHLLAVFKPDGTPAGFADLDEKLFPQPEGITFLPNGDMLISNEGQGKTATLLLFEFRQ